MTEQKTHTTGTRVGFAFDKRRRFHGTVVEHRGHDVFVRMDDGRVMVFQPCEIREETR